jgi:predicted SprT family Zn-dependent metalloprotease
MIDTNIFIFACIQMLGIQKPVEIRLLSNNKNKTTKDFAAWAETRNRKGVIYKHVIFTNLAENIESKYNLHDVIAHELVHSIMLETGKHNDKRHHDKSFQAICTILEKGLKDIGMPVGKLYDPVIDNS